MGFRPIIWPCSSDASPPRTLPPIPNCPLRRSNGRRPSRMTLTDRARNVRLLCVDVDGVLTDGGMYYGADGEVLKKFNTRDAMGLARVRDIGIAVALISGEDSDIVRSRARKLKIDDVFCG